MTHPLGFDAHLVLRDSYDRDAAARAFSGNPAVAELLDRGAHLLPHFDALLDDLFSALFKLNVVLRSADECPKATLVARRLLTSVLASEGFATLKEETTLDAARAGHAALKLGRRVLGLLKTGEMLTEEELLSAKELAREEESAQQKRAAADDLKALAGDMAKFLAEQATKSEQKADELAKALSKSVSEIGPRFDGELANAAAQLADDLPKLEDSADGFARATTGQGPRSANERLQLADKLASSQKLQQLARLAGAFRADARAARRKKRERAPTEVFRVGRGGDLGRLLPSELVALRHPLRRRDFLRRLIEGELGQYDLRGDDRAGRGPLVVCIDGSGSMAGKRELWSKAVTLALLDIARRQGRKARAIVFAGPENPLSQFDLTGKGRKGDRRAVDLEQVVKLAECFPAGGTDFEKPLRAALEAVKTSALKGADVVFITDGEAQITEPFSEEFKKEKKKRDISVYAIVVDDPSKNAVKGARMDERAARELGKVADALTTVTQLTSESVKELFRAL